MKILKLLIIILSVYFPTGFFADSDLFVRRKNAKLLFQPSNVSKTITSLNKGTKLNQIGKKGLFYKVQYQGKEGWVHSLYVSKQKRNEDCSVNGYENISKETSHKLSRKHASKYTETAAARGLDKSKNCK